MTTTTEFFLFLSLALLLWPRCQALSMPTPKMLSSSLTTSSTALSFSTTTTTTTTTTSSSSSSSTNPLSDFDYHNNEKIPWMESGYCTWRWMDQYDINYIELGDTSKPALVLIHGFGASSFHFRYNLPALAKHYHVFAFCKLGFGLSDKPVQEYSAEVWRDQTVDFLRQVVQKPAVLVGNSLGGFTSLYAAATDDVKHLVRGVVLMNGAGRFRPEQGETTAAILDVNDQKEEPRKNVFVERLQTFIQRTVIAASFVFTKQPARIEQILKQVYPINSDNVDRELVESIRYPSLDPNAAEVFYRVISKNGNGPPKVYIDDLLEQMDCPLLLCWGESDPWIRSAAADKIQQLKPSTLRVSIDAGHCPHDENPEAVNEAILTFMETAAGMVG